MLYDIVGMIPATLSKDKKSAYFKLFSFKTVFCFILWVTPILPYPMLKILNSKSTGGHILKTFSLSSNHNPASNGKVLF